MKLEFYQWLVKWAKKQTRKYVYCNIRCENCLCWSSEQDHNVVRDIDDFRYEYECGQCKKISIWNAGIAPVAIYEGMKS